MKLEYDKVDKELETVRERQLLHTTKPFRIKMTKLVYSGQTNWETLSRLFEFLRPHLLGFDHSPPDPFQQLIRLRLGSFGMELGYQFKIHPSTVSWIFSDVTEMLFEVSNCLSREESFTKKNTFYANSKELSKLCCNNRLFLNFNW